jgi:ferredoxin
MSRVESMWEAAGAANRLRLERFTPPGGPAPSPDDDGEVRAIELHLARTGRAIAATTAGTLLEQMEQAGERPPHGCRMGICHTCRCRKRTGTVRNLLTGAVSSEQDEEIQICISVPRSNVELQL